MKNQKEEEDIGLKNNGEKERWKKNEKCRRRRSG